ncbi:hypothetical protein R3P38DRAFT_2784921 [Favolaschia claudopus]|uniref:Uncharacterized protein n=1 Tax=Favolaschia claudopus TaxID=2862362 RepID=A0AAW0AVI3_9AGAR
MPRSAYNIEFKKRGNKAPGYQRKALGWGEFHTPISTWYTTLVLSLLYICLYHQNDDHFVGSNELWLSGRCSAKALGQIEMEIEMKYKSTPPKILGPPVQTPFDSAWNFVCYVAKTYRRWMLMSYSIRTFIGETSFAGGGRSPKFFPHEVNPWISDAQNPISTAAELTFYTYRLAKDITDDIRADETLVCVALPLRLLATKLTKPQIKICVIILVKTQGVIPLLWFFESMRRLHRINGRKRVSRGLHKENLM